MGKQPAGIAAGLFGTREDRPRASGWGGAKCIRALRYGCQRARVVLRLVQRGLLWRIAGPQSPRPRARHASRIQRRLLAALHEGFTLRCAIEHPSRISIRGLWLSPAYKNSINANIGSRTSPVLFL